MILGPIAMSEVWHSSARKPSHVGAYSTVNMRSAGRVREVDARRLAGVLVRRGRQRMRRALRPG
jgi:hypothetical protein